MRVIRVLLGGVAVIVGGTMAGCSGGSPPPPAPAATTAPQEAPVTNNTIVTQLSRPDEAVAALASVQAPAEWKKYVSAETAVASTDKLKVVAAIGMQSANGVVSEYAGDEATAQALGESVKGLAKRLSLSSAELDRLVGKAAVDWKEPDAAKRSKLVRDDIVEIQDELKATLDRLGDGAASTMMLFGAWVEGVRMASTLLNGKYDATASSVLNRRHEAEYFLASFASAPSKADPLYAQLTPGLARLKDAMTVNASRQLDQKAIATIQTAATELAGLLRK